MLKRVLMVLTVVGVCVGLDQLTKQLALTYLAGTDPMSWLWDVFRLQYAENPGVFMSLGASLDETWRFWLFTVFKLGVLAVLIMWVLWYAPLTRSNRIGLALIIGGGVGNLTDRLMHDGVVIDFLNVGIGAVRSGIFNLADVFITAGVVWLLTDYTRHYLRRPA